jgi:hypothetical protein
MLNVIKSLLNSSHLGRLVTWLAPLLILAATATAAADSVRLEDLGFAHLHQDWGKPGKDKSVEGHPLTIGGRVFERGRRPPRRRAAPRRSGEMIGLLCGENTRINPRNTCSVTNKSVAIAESRVLIAAVP